MRRKRKEASHDETPNTDRNIFAETNIVKAGEAYTEHMGQYPVIKLTLKSAKRPDFHLAYTLLAREIADEFRRHRYVLEEELSEMLMQTISFYDAQESFYHGFVAGVLGGMDRYIVKSNREGGRTDLIIKPLTRRKTAFIVEFKVADAYQALERRADDALAQIEERQYKKVLADDGYSDIVCYGIAFYRKECRVKIG